MDAGNLTSHHYQFIYVRDGITKDGIDFRLRPADSSDAEAIAANIQAVCDEQVYLYSDTFVLTNAWRQSLACSVDESGGHLLVVAQVGQTVVGHLRLFSEWYGAKGRHVGEIGLALIEPWRERGIGSAMMDYAFEWAEHAGFQKLTASVIATNRRALNLFAKFGFVQEGCRAQQLNVSGKYVDEILLGRFLNEHQAVSAG